MSLENILEVWNSIQPSCIDRDNEVQVTLFPYNPQMYCNHFKYECIYRKEDKDKFKCVYNSYLSFIDNLTKGLNT
jgi:hypothetical protein